MKAVPSPKKHVSIACLIVSTRSAPLFLGSPWNALAATTISTIQSRCVTTIRCRHSSIRSTKMACTTTRQKFLHHHSCCPRTSSRSTTGSGSRKDRQAKSAYRENDGNRRSTIRRLACHRQTGNRRMTSSLTSHSTAIWRNFPTKPLAAKGKAARTGLHRVPGIHGQAIRFDGDSGATFPGLFEVDRWDAFTLDFWLRDNAANDNPVVVLQRTFGTDVGYNGFDLMLENGILEARFYRVWPGNGIGVKIAHADCRQTVATHHCDVRWVEHGCRSAAVS